MTENEIFDGKLPGPENEPDGYVLRLARQTDAEDIYRVMKLSHDALQDKSLYICDDLNYVRETLDGAGFGVLACTSEGKVIGSFLFECPGLSMENLGREIGLSEPNLCQVLHVESAAVVPEYRGHGLQYRMLCFALRAVDRRRFRFFLGTASPKNGASCRTFKKAGFRAATVHEKLHGFQRIVYYKKADA